MIDSKLFKEINSFALSFVKARLTVSSQNIIFEDLIGRIRDIEVNSKGELFLINSNSNASLWKMSKE